MKRAMLQLILDSTLDMGHPLPASRALAKALGVSRDTVDALRNKADTAHA